jgi:hypothetical protein
MTRIIADIPVSLDGFITGPGPSPDNGAPRALVQRSVIPASTATHLTYGISR